MMSAEGVPIMTGLDTARGKTIADEIELLVRAGLSPAAALRAATIAPANHLGMADSLGTIDSGKFADAVILNGNPLEDVRAARRVHGVVANGRLLIEERPPVIDMHQHSAQLTPKAFAQMAASNMRYVFLSSVRRGCDPRRGFSDCGSESRHFVQQRGSVSAARQHSLPAMSARDTWSRFCD
jgi:hypothetical protein